MRIWLGSELGASIIRVGSPEESPGKACDFPRLAIVRLVGVMWNCSNKRECQKIDSGMSEGMDLGSAVRTMDRGWHRA